MAKRWYIVHAHSGFEKKVANSIKEQAAKKGLEEYFEDVYVPVEKVTEVKKGKKIDSEKKFFPGYVMVKMEMNDEAWQVVKNTPRVAGFLGGGGNKPQPISNAEAENIFKQIEEGASATKSGKRFEYGETVKVIDGPFDSFTGVIEDVDEGKEKLKVAVSIFGRATPVELDYGQVEKVSA